MVTIHQKKQGWLLSSLSGFRLTNQFTSMGTAEGGRVAPGVPGFWNETGSGISLLAGSCDAASRWRLAHMYCMMRWKGAAWPSDIMCGAVLCCLGLEMRGQAETGWVEWLEWLNPFTAIDRPTQESGCAVHAAPARVKCDINATQSGVNERRKRIVLGTHSVYHCTPASADRGRLDPHEKKSGAMAPIRLAEKYPITIQNALCFPHWLPPLAGWAFLALINTPYSRIVLGTGN